MSNEKEPTFDQLKETLTDSEIAESYVLRSELSEGERNIAEEEFRKLRMEQLKSMSDQQALQGEIMRMKLLIKEYIDQHIFLPSFSFGEQIKQYIRLIGISQSQFADNINLHKTKLSRIINSKEKPNVELMYRLEIHSGGMIPANYWYRLFSLEIEEDIKSNTAKREIESEKVKNELSFKLSA